MATYSKCKNVLKDIAVNMDYNFTKNMDIFFKDCSFTFDYSDLPYDTSHIVPNRMTIHENIYSNCPYLIFNIGCGEKIKLLDFIEILEQEIGIKAIKNFTKMQKGDVVNTFSNNEKIIAYTQYQPQYTIKSGIKLFIKWYKNFYGF